MMVKFFHYYDEDRPTFDTPDYPQTIDVIKSVINEEGREVFEVVDQRNFYKEIQMQKESCDMKTIIQRFLNGDETVLSRAQGVYLDAREYPSNRQEAMNVAFEIEAAYNRLPEDERSKFADIYDFAVKLVSPVEEIKDDKPVEEVKPDASAT